MKNTHDFFQNLKSIVRYHRKKMGLSQSDFAKIAGVGKTVIFDIEHAKKTVKLETLLKVLTALNIQIKFQSPLMKAYKKVEL